MEQPNRLQCISRDMLKYIAAVCMLIGYFLVYTIKELQLLGLRPPVSTLLYQLQFIAPPIFFFFIAEGFRYTRSRKKYALRLLIAAFVTQIAKVLCCHLTFSLSLFLHSWNVMVTLLLGLAALMLWECKLLAGWHAGVSLVVRCLLVGACCAVSFLLQAEWAIAGVLFILNFHVFRERPYLRMLLYEVIVLGYVSIGMGGIGAILSQWNLIAAMTLPILLITWFYNGEKGRHPVFAKWFFYLFYPAHLLLIFVVRLLAGGQA